MKGSQDHVDEQSKRDFLRLHLGVLGLLETLNGRHRVEIVDLSQGGAHVVLVEGSSNERYEVRDCVLRWMEYEAFGEVKRREGPHFGIAFDEPLRPGVIKTTRERAPGNVRNDHGELQQAARLWAYGIYST